MSLSQSTPAMTATGIRRRAVAAGLANTSSRFAASGRESIEVLLGAHGPVRRAGSPDSVVGPLSQTSSLSTASWPLTVLPRRRGPRRSHPGRRGRPLLQARPRLRAAEWFPR